MKNEEGTLTKWLISRLSIVVDNSKWHQLIAKTMFYCHASTYLKHYCWQPRFNKLCWSSSFIFLLILQFFRDLFNIHKI